MSRPFPDTFEDERSPLTPLSGGPPNSISYQANVNRRKTKKWVDAKPASYGGDDWGDEYDDEYDAAPPPPEVPKPTGFRQPGQGLGGLQQPAGNYNDGRKPYGDLPTGPAMGADRSATLPPLLRRNSFGEDDERRAFSSGSAQFLKQCQQAPQLHVQTQAQQQNMAGFRGQGPQPMATPPVQAPGAFPETPYSIAESQTSYMDQPQQQPYQPASPADARGVPIQPGYGKNASPMAGGRPPRNSSLSQSSIPDVSNYQSHSRERSQEPAMKPWPGPGVASPGGSAPAAKALPFVRPADIYKRLEEERTKERQSMESGRPSMDSITGQREREMSSSAAPPSSGMSQPQDQYARGRSGSQSEYTDSGRRLGQSLEPVAERKSEYSFMDASTRSPDIAQKLEEIRRTEVEAPYQPYGKSSQENAPQISYNDSSLITENDSSFEEEKRRRFSTSPKLPDLNRMSGFGFDMWGAPPTEPEAESAPPVVASAQPAAKVEDPTLRKKPSLGFNSVVHQAFDRNDSFSDARDPLRTGSDASVGTAGISPINTRDGFIADDSTPMIAEEKEPDSRRGSGHATPKQGDHSATPSQQMPFHLGHRRDLSAPLGGNSRDASPARTPIVKTPAVVGPGVQVHVSEESETSPAADEEKQIEDAARYENYPRPPIPGGWTSYATTGGDSVLRLDEPNVNAPVDTSEIAPFTADIIASNPLPDEFSPAIAAKTEEIRPPSPENAAVIQPKAADDHSPFIASQMDNVRIPSPSTEHAPGTTAPVEFSPSLAKEMDIVALPTPDPHMGPIGNPYSTAPIDPRIDGGHSQQETPVSNKSTDTITGLLPPTINEPGVSPGSSVGPTPPPKDTPRMSGLGNAEYFPPLVPLKPKTAEEVAAAEGLAPPQRPAMIPTLSTNTSPFDDENDKLRKEIVKSLSPRQSLSGPSSQGPPHHQGQSMLGVSSSDAPRESMYLPSEYDSYWGATGDEPSTYSQPEEATPATPQNDVKVNVTAASPGSEDAGTPPIPPLNPKRVSRTSMSSIPGFTAGEPRRYSFDKGQESGHTKERSNQSTPALAAVDASPSVQEIKAWTPSLAENGSAKGKLPVDLQRADSASPAPLSIRSAKTDRASDVSSQKPAEEAHSEGILGTMAAVGAAVAATVLPIGGPSADPDDASAPKDKDMEKSIPTLDGVIVDEDDHINDTSLSAEVSPVSATTVQDIPPMMNVIPPPHQQQSSMLPSPLNISRPTTAVSNQSHGMITGMVSQNQAPPMHFREIMVMPSPEQRIEAYIKTRAQYAQMNSGLTDWLAAQTGVATLTPPHGAGQGTNRSEAGSVAPSAPAPYYQQYLNASPASTPVSNMGTTQRHSTLGAIGLGTQASFNSGSRGQQNAQQAAQQAKEKGKELLHSAGIFGGAVGKKGKGLFKKGTSRWLGGGGDKETPETPPVPSKPEGYTPSVGSMRFSAVGATTFRPSMSVGGVMGGSLNGRDGYPAFPMQQRDASPSPRGPMPSMTPVENSPKPTPTKRRTSWLKNLGRHSSHGGQPPSRGKQDSQDGNNPPRRAFSHDITNILHGRRPSFNSPQQQQQQQQQPGQFRPPFSHQHCGSFHASPQHSFGPSEQRPQICGSPAGSYGRQRCDRLSLPPGVVVDAREVSGWGSGTPPATQPVTQSKMAPQMAPQTHLDLPPPTMRDDHWLSTSPAHTASPHLSAANSSQHHSSSPHPSQSTSRHASGVPSLTTSQQLDSEEAIDRFDINKDLPSLDAVQDDHEHTGVKPPVPIGKYQPSWDPFNATPIQEEREGSEFSFGGGKVSPPKVSPLGLGSVEEGGGREEGEREGILAGVAGVALAAGAVTTGAAIVTGVDEDKEVQEGGREEMNVGEREVEEDEEDIYDASPPIPGTYAHVRGDGQLAAINQGPMMLTPHQQAAFRQSQQPPTFADQRSYEEYMRQQQAFQAQQQGLYASLPPPPATSYNATRQEAVPTQFRRASQEYVRDLNSRSSQEYSRRNSNTMAGDQQPHSRPSSQRNEPVGVPAWKRAIRDTPNTTPSPANTAPPPTIGSQGDFPHLTAFNPNASKAPDTPEPQGRSRPFLGLSDDRRNSNLSTEDLLARSPARAQFGQQAPYQLSLPGGDDDEDEDIPRPRRSPPKTLVPALPAGVSGVALAGAALAGHRESSPLSREHQHQASNVSVPETAFSPSMDRGQGMRTEDIPPLPVPKWSAPPTPTGGVHNSHRGHPQHQVGVGLLHLGSQVYQPNQMLSRSGGKGVGRSNTVMSDVSIMTVEDSSHTPSPRRHGALAPSAQAGGPAYGYNPAHEHNKSISTSSPIIGDRLSQVQSHSSGMSVSPRSTPNDTPIVQQAQSVPTHRPVVEQSRTEPVVQRIRIPSDIRSPPIPQSQQQLAHQEQQEAPPVPLQMPAMPTTQAPDPPIEHRAGPANATGSYVIQDDARPAERPTVITQHPDHSGLIYDNSREGLIVVEDANVRRVNQGAIGDEDEGPVMSATSFPGDEWRPYGWEEGVYD